MASGTAPSPLYFINSNRHSCPAVIFPECPTAVLSSGLRLDGALCSCFYNVGGILPFSRRQETGTFFFFFSTLLRKIHQTATGDLQTSTQPRTESLKPTFKALSRHLAAHTVMLQKLEASTKERKKERKNIISRLLNFLHWVCWDGNKRKKNCNALLWRRNKSPLHPLQ